MDSDGKLIKSFLPEPEVVDSESASYILLDMMRDVVDEYKFKYQDENNNGKYDKDEHVYGRGTGHKLRTKYNFGFEYNDYNGNGFWDIDNDIWNGNGICYIESGGCLMSL